MARALKAVGTAIVIAGLAVATGGAALALGAGVGLGGAAALASSTVLSIGSFSISAGALLGVGSLVSSVGGALSQPKVSTGGEAIVWRADPNAPLHFPAGRIGVAGQIVHRKAFGPDDRMYMGIVSVVGAAGPIDGWETFKADDFTVSFDGSGEATSSPFQDKKMWIRRQNGAQPTTTALASPAGLKSGASLPGWSSSHKLNGKAAFMLTLAENSKLSAFNRTEPKVLNVIRGLLVYDPRLDSTYPGGSGSHRLNNPATWTYSANPILWGLKWALGLWEGPTGKGAPQVDMQVGGIGTDIGAIDVASFVEAANIADANGWTCAARPSTDDSKAQVLDAFLQAGGAYYIERAGKIACLHRAAPRASVTDVTAADTAGPIELDTGVSRIDRKNTITPSYLSEQDGWKITAGEEVTAEAWRTEDGGRVWSEGITYSYVSDATQAGQLAALQAAHTREGISGRIPLKPYMQGLEPGDAFTITEANFVLNGLKCLCLETSYDAGSGVHTVTFVSESDDKYPFALGQTQDPPAPPALTPVDPTYVTPPGAEDWVIIPRMPGEDGVQVPIIDVVGEVTNATATEIIVEWGAPPAEEDPGEPLVDQIAWKVGYSGPPTTTEISISGLQPGQLYYLAVTNRRGQNYSDRVMLPGGPFTAPGLTASVAIVVPEVPTGLSLTSSSSADSVTGDPVVKLVATWDANEDETLSGYQWEWTPEGVEPYTGWTVTPRAEWVAQTGVEYSVRVRALTQSGGVSDWSAPETATGAGDTTPPSAPTSFTASPSISAVYLAWTAPSASDVVAVEVWEHTSNASGSATRRTVVAAQPGKDGAWTRAGLSAGDVRYFWLKAVDRSGNVSAFSSVASATVPSVPVGSVDTTPPAAPTSLTLSTSVSTDATGLPRSKVIATWTAPSDTDLAGYDVEITESGGTAQTAVVATARHEIEPARPGISYSIRVRAYDRAGNRSSYTSASAITAGGDTTAPSAPTSLSATSSLTAVYLSVTAPADADVAAIEIWEHTSNSSGSATRLGSVPVRPSAPAAFTRSGLASGVTRYYWAKAVDRSGNVSAFSSVATATTAKIDVTDFASTIVPPELMTATERLAATPTLNRMVFDTTLGKLYRGTGSGWVLVGAGAAAADVTGQLTDAQIAAVAAAKVTGQITATQITDGAVSTPKLAAGAVEAANIAAGAIVTEKLAADAVTAAKILAGSVTTAKLAAGAVTANELAADSVIAGKIAAGAIGATEIAAGAITAGKIGAGEVTTEKLAASAVTADKITSGAVTADKIGAGEVTTAKLAAGAVTAAKIGAGEITSDKLTVGNLNITNLGVRFGANSGATGIEWTSGWLHYRTASSVVSTNVSSGSAAYSGSVVYVYWTPGSSSLSATTTQTTAYAQGNVVLAIYSGGTSVNVMVGETVIDSSGIRTGAIVADKIAAGAITTEKLAAGSVTATELAAGAITAVKIAAGAVIADKIASGAITADKIGAGEVTTAKLAAGAVTANEIAAGAVTAVKIAADTIDASKLTLNNRNLGSINIQFEGNAGGVTNRLAWSSGFINAPTATGGTPVSVSSGTADWSGSTVYVYWSGGSTLNATTSINTAYGPGAAIIAVYGGGATVDTVVGKTVINGSQIKTGSITADRISVVTLDALAVDAGVITAGLLRNSANTAALDLTNSLLRFARDGYEARMTLAGTGVVLWYGLASVTRGTETRTNGVFALGTDGKVYLGSTALDNPSAAWVCEPANISRTGGTVGGSGVVTSNSLTFNNTNAPGSVSYSFTQVFGEIVSISGGSTGPWTWSVTPPAGVVTYYRTIWQWTATSGGQTRTGQVYVTLWREQ